MPSLDNMKLYIKPGCPYCMKVDRFLEGAGLQIEHLDIYEGSNADDLVSIGGKRQVPCLTIDGAPMYESDDIIDYLRQYA